MSRIIANFNADIRAEWITQPRFSPQPMIEVTSSNWFNPNLNYNFFRVPSILAFLVTMVTAYMTSLNIVKEKKVGTIEQINVTPIKRHLFILGKLIPFWIIRMFIFSVGLFIVARVIYFYFTVI